MVTLSGNDRTKRARTVSRVVISFGKAAFLVSSLYTKNTKPERIENNEDKFVGIQNN